MTKIEWTEQLWNPIAGCDIVSPGCKNCYAMKMAARQERMNPDLEHYQGLTKPSKSGPVWTGKIGIAPDHILFAPLRRKKPTTYFVNSMSDLFHDGVPDDVIDRVYAVMALSPQHTFQVLTKRPERMFAYLTGIDRFYCIWKAGCKIMPDMTARTCWRIENLKFLPNVWLGVSAERQKEANERTPYLLATPAAVRFVSAEPLLGPIDFENIEITSRLDSIRPTQMQEPYSDDWPKMLYDVLRGHQKWEDNINEPKLNWVITGGESGTNARLTHPDWVRQIRDQCAAHNTPFFSNSGEAISHWKQTKNATSTEEAKCSTKSELILDMPIPAKPKPDVCLMVNCTTQCQILDKSEMTQTAYITENNHSIKRPFTLKIRTFEGPEVEWSDICDLSKEHAVFLNKESGIQWWTEPDWEKHANRIAELTHQTQHCPSFGHFPMKDLK